MIFDATLLFSNNQPLAGGGLTQISSNTIDLGAVGVPVGVATGSARDVGKGRRIPLACRVTEQFTNLTTLEVQVQADTTTAFASPVIVFRSPAYPLAKLVRGAHLLPTDLPVETDRRYVRLAYVMTGTAPATGKLMAGVVMADHVVDS